MDFIERWFGLSPDGGSGGLEISLTTVALLVLATPLLLNMFRSARAPIPAGDLSKE